MHIYSSFHEAIPKKVVFLRRLRIKLPVLYKLAILVLTDWSFIKENFRIHCMLLFMLKFLLCNQHFWTLHMKMSLSVFLILLIIRSCCYCWSNYGFKNWKTSLLGPWLWLVFVSIFWIIFASFIWYLFFFAFGLIFFGCVA